MKTINDSLSFSEENNSSAINSGLNLEINTSINLGQKSNNSSSSQIDPQLYLVFLDTEATGETLEARASSVLDQAGINNEVETVFNALDGFTIRLDNFQAESLSSIDGVRGIDTNNQIFLTDPIEIDNSSLDTSPDVYLDYFVSSPGIEPVENGFVIGPDPSVDLPIYNNKNCRSN